MKKNYFMLAAATMMLAACAETGLVDELVVEETQQVIGFETFAERATRHSTVSTMNTYHDNFGVFAYNDGDGLFMDNYKVQYGTAWEYNNILTGQNTKYWNKLVNYDFYAYAPYDATVDFEDGKFTIPQGDYAAVENLQKSLGDLNTTAAFTDDVDWMVATGINDYTYAQCKIDGDKVPFTFNHMLSKLVVKLSTSSLETIDVTSLNITGDTYKTGSYDGDKWTPSNNVTLTGEVGEITSTGGNYYSMEYLLIPTATAAPKLSISYNVNGQTYTQNDIEISDITAFAPNTYYTLTVTIGLEDIKFNATAASWGASATPGVTIQ